MNLKQLILIIFISLNSFNAYAYIDISKVWKTNPYYWNVIWNDQRPDWIPAQIGVTDSFYIKYWRNEWLDILKTVLPNVISKNYDGIVFGGGDGFDNFPIAN